MLGVIIAILPFMTTTELPEARDVIGITSHDPYHEYHPIIHEHGHRQHRRRYEPEKFMDDQDYFHRTIDTKE
jgi:hypothetical protein